MKQRARLVLASTVLVVVVVLLIPGPSAGREPTPPSLPPPVAVQADALAPAYSGCGGQFAPVVNAAFEQEVVDRVNSVRASNGLPPLKRVDLLEAAARYHSTDMWQDDYVAHDSHDRNWGGLVWVCGWPDRVGTYYSNWRTLAENVAMGYQTPAEAIDAWMNSEGHRENILRTTIWEIGVGYYKGSSDWPTYWVQDFGRRWDVYPLIIDRDAAVTTSPEVSLYIYGAGDWEEMRLRNDDGAWTGWQPFQSELSWTLPAARGEHTVWAELRDGDRSALTSDSIFLDLVSPVLGELPASLSFVYNQRNGRLLPPFHELVPENTGSDQTLAWQLAQEGAWFEASPTAGTTPAAFRIVPTTLDSLAPGTYTGTVTVTVVDPPGTVGSPQTISLQLDVVDRPVYYVFVPLVRH